MTFQMRLASAVGQTIELKTSIADFTPTEKQKKPYAVMSAQVNNLEASLRVLTNAYNQFRNYSAQQHKATVNLYQSGVPLDLDPYGEQEFHETEINPKTSKKAKTKQRYSKTTFDELGDNSSQSDTSDDDEDDKHKNDIAGSSSNPVGSRANIEAEEEEGEEINDDVFKDW
jgi:hypothetical protein